MRSIPTTLRTLAVVAGLWMLLTTSLSAQQFRAAWADVFHTGMGSQAEVDTMVSNLVAGKYNAVVVQVLAYMDNATPSHGAYWKSSIVPWSSHVTANFEPLAYLCQQAHANGIEVHAWLGGSGTGMYRVSLSWPPSGNTTLAAHPEWFMVPRANSEGGAVVPYTVNSSTYYALDMGSSDAQEYIVSIIRELVTNYPIDGIHWDDEVDGPVYTAGMAFPACSQANYQNSGLARYRRNTGYVGTPNATDATYNNYRRRFKNELIARCQAEIQSIKTNPRQPLRHSASVMCYGSAPSSCTFTGATAYTYYSDWAGMLKNGWLDTAIPMNYEVQATGSTAYHAWCDRPYSCWRYNRDIFMGVGADSNPKADVVTQLQYAYGDGYDGTVIYSYALPDNDGAGWWTYVATNLYTNTATVPAMSWRNPATATEGMMWGRVQDSATGFFVDNATVSVTNLPAVNTDGNGYYEVTTIPAVASGTAYSVTASKTGMTSQRLNASVLAGDIVRYDFVLNSGLPAAPTGLTATVAGPSQINLSWTDNSSNENAFVVARSTTPAGPYTDIASLPPNSVSYTNADLPASTTYYYVVRATNLLGAAISSQASATTPTNTPPVITSQPQRQTILVNSGATFAVAATGTFPLSYQWNFNGAAIPGATSTSYTIVSAQYSHGGNYSVTITNGTGSATSSNAALTVLSGVASLQLVNIWNIQAGSRDYVTSNNTERGICINPFTDHVLLVSRSAQLVGGLGIFVLDANTGTEVGTMDTNGVSNAGTFVLNKIDVANDGVIYGGNLTTASSTNPFVIYRWSNESATATVAYSGSPDGGTTARWGDTFSVTGTGVNTRILISGSGATNTVLFTTTDGTNFVANILNPSATVSGGTFARGLYLLDAGTFYVKTRNAGAGEIYNYNPAVNSASIATNITPLEGNMIAIAPVTYYNFLAGIIDDNTTNNSGHTLKVYDISSPATPLVVSNFYFPTFGSGTNSSNSNVAGAVDTDGTRIVALDTQNGVVALRIAMNAPAPYIDSLALSSSALRHFQLNADPGNFVIQASSDFSNWIDLSVTRTNGIFEVSDPSTNSLRFYRTKN